MGNGMSFKAGRDMPPGMQEKLAMKMVADLQQKNGVPPEDDIQRSQARQIQQLRSEGMERLTKMKYPVMKPEFCPEGDCLDPSFCPALKKNNRLFEYEETGLTPEEIKKLDSHRKAMAALADSYKAEIPKWIPVEESLPEESTAVLTYRDSGIEVEFRENTHWDYDEFSPCPVTHWMPLPAPPEVNSDGV